MLPCRHHHAEIRKSDVEVLITTFQVRGDTVVVRIHVGDGEAAGSEIVEERKPRTPAEPLTEQGVDFCGDRGRYHELPRLVSE